MDQVRTFIRKSDLFPKRSHLKQDGNNHSIHAAGSGELSFN